MNFKQYIKESDKLAGLKNFIASSELDQTFNPESFIFTQDKPYYESGKMVISPKEVCKVLGRPNKIGATSYFDPVKNKPIVGTFIEWGLEFKDSLRLSINLTIENVVYIDPKLLDSYGSIKNMEAENDIIFNVLQKAERLEDFTIDTWSIDAWSDSHSSALEEIKRRLNKLFSSAKFEID